MPSGSSSVAQRDEIELIASENIVSRAVLEAAGSVLTNKYAEGTAGPALFGGCQYVDIAETLAIERVTRLFGCRLPTCSRIPARRPTSPPLWQLMNPGDTFLGLNLAAAGTYPWLAVNMSGKWFKPVPYSVSRDDHRIDMEEVARSRAASPEGDHRGRLGLSAHLRLRLPSAQLPTRSAPI